MSSVDDVIRGPIHQPGAFNIEAFFRGRWRGGMNRTTREDAIDTAKRWATEDSVRHRVFDLDGQVIFDTDAPAFTPGPWQWETTPGGEVRLVTPDRGKLYVMGFVRKGMRGAQPTFSLWGDGPRTRRGGIMHGFLEAAGARHPDARLIAAAPELYAALDLCRTEIRALTAACGIGVMSERTLAAADAALAKAGA